MPATNKKLVFPSGLSVVRAKKRAKESVKNRQFLTLTEAQNAISQSEMGIPWSKAIRELSDQTGSRIQKFMTADDILAVMEQIPELTHHGYGAYRGYGMPLKEYLAKVDEEKRVLRGAVDECNKACMYIQHLEKRKTINRNFSSYTLKHLAEHYLSQLGGIEERYIANGSFICAAHFMGFDVQQVKAMSLNASFNFSMRSPVIQWSKLRNESDGSAKCIRELDGMEKQLGLRRSELVASNEFLLR